MASLLHVPTDFAASLPTNSVHQFSVRTVQDVSRKKTLPCEITTCSRPVFVSCRWYDRKAMEITTELGRNREKIGEVHDKVRSWEERTECPMSVSWFSSYKPCHVSLGRSNPKKERLIAVGAFPTTLDVPAEPQVITNDITLFRSSSRTYMPEILCPLVTHNSTSREKYAYDHTLFFTTKLFSWTCKFRQQCRILSALRANNYQTSPNSKLRLKASFIFTSRFRARTKLLACL